MQTLCLDALIALHISQVLPAPNPSSPFHIESTSRQEEAASKSRTATSVSRQPMAEKSSDGGANVSETHAEL